MINLNSSQLRAVTAREPIVSVVAGAGSGKTRVLVESIVNLINNGVEPHSILAITFTNKAAREARERIQNETVTVCTIHSWCLKILRRHIKNLTIWTSDDSEKAMEIVMKRFGKKYDKEMVDTIDYCINTMVPFPNTVASIYKAYRSYMEECNAVDFSHMLLKACELLQDQRILRLIQDRYKYILVDEYQDVSKLQHEMVKLVKTDYLFIVGDPWQSIYGFRGGSPDFMNELYNIEGGAQVVLDTNYRNPKQVNFRAQQLMGEQRVDKCTSHIESDVCINMSYEEEEEAYKILNAIRRLDSNELGKSVVLYRTHAYARVLQEHLYKNKIPFHVYGQTMLFKRKIIRDIMAYIKLSINTHDDMSFLRIVNTPRRGIGDKKLDIIHRQSPMYEYAMQVFPSNLANLKQLMEYIQHEPTTIRKVEAIIDVLNPDNPVIVREISSIAEEHPNVEEFMEYAEIYDSGNPKDKLTLMTIHAAKGLEFDNVFIIGVNNGLIPHSKGDLEEERRMLYVAITRGIKKVNIYSLFGKESSFTYDIFSREEMRKYA